MVVLAVLDVNYKTNIMKKSILNLGKTLNKTTQKEINGGYIMPTCSDLGWNSYTCSLAENEPPIYDKWYRKCCTQ